MPHPRPQAYYVRNRDLARARFFRIKEKTVMENLERWFERRFPATIRTYDKVANTQVRFRVDMQIIVSDRWRVLIELDEHSHGGHARRHADLQRYERIAATQPAGVTLYTIRFNPDEHYSTDGTKNASMFRLDAGVLIKNRREYKRRMKQLKFELLKALNFFGQQGPKQPVYRFIGFDEDVYHKRPQSLKIDSDGTASLYSDDDDDGDGGFDVTSDVPYSGSDTDVQPAASEGDGYDSGSSGNTVIDPPDTPPPQPRKRKRKRKPKPPPAPTPAPQLLGKGRRKKRANPDRPRPS